MSDFDVLGARKAGYSDKEIADYLAAQKGFDAEGARKAGYKDSEIVQHLSPVSPKESMMRGVGDALDTGYGFLRTIGNTALAGAAAIPRAALEGIDWIGRQDAEKGGTGARVPESIKNAFPSFDEANNALNKPHMPYSSLWDEQAFKDWQARKDTPRPEVTSGNPYVDAVVTGIVTAPFTGGTNWPMLAANVLGNVGSEVAGRIPGVKDTPWELPARAVGAVGGAGLGVASVRGANMLKDAGKAVIAPFGKEGVDVAAGQGFNRIATNPAEALKNIEQYNTAQTLGLDKVLGFNLDVGRASRDQGLLALAETSPAKGAMAQSNNAAVTATLDRLGAGLDPKKFVDEITRLDAQAGAAAKQALDALPAGTDAATAGKAIQDALAAREAALTTARKNAADPLYAAARNSNATIDPVSPWAYAQNIAETGKDAVAALGKRLANLFETGAETPQQMMAARDAVGRILKEDGVVKDNYLRSIAEKTLRKIDQSLAVVPEEMQARSVFAQHSKPLDIYNADKGFPTNAAVVDKPYLSTNFSTPVEKVPALYFRPGDAGAATMKEFLATNPSAPERGAMAAFIAEKARTAPDIKAFLLQNKAAIETLDPGLARQLESAAATKSISEGFAASPAGKFINGDLDAAVKQALGAQDSAQRLQALRMTVGGNPEAVGGLQKAILDDFRRVAEANVQTAGGDPMILANGAAKWLKDNRGAVSNVLTMDQVSALDDIVRNLKAAGQTPAGRTGSPTFDRLAQQSILSAVIGRSELPTWLHPVQKALGWIYGGANEAAQARMIEAIKDPAVAAALMKKATPGNVKMAEPILLQIGQGARAPLTQAGRE